MDRADDVAGRSCSSPRARCWRRSRSPRCAAGRFNLARYTCVAQIVALLAGWAAAQWPFLIYPDLTVANAAAPASTLSLTAWTLPFGLGALFPALWFLFRVFKSARRDAPRLSQSRPVQVRRTRSAAPRRGRAASQRRRDAVRARLELLEGVEPSPPQRERVGQR